jgi:hypothetical protein
MEEATAVLGVGVTGTGEGTYLRGDSCVLPLGAGGVIPRATQLQATDRMKSEWWQPAPNRCWGGAESGREGS